MAITRTTILTFVGILLIIGYTEALLGGTDATALEFPWTVSARVDGTHKCVGCIIDKDFILTAGSCFSASRNISIESNRVTVRIGSTNQFAGGQIIKVNLIIIHPSYGNFLHNIALLKLEHSLEFSEKVAKIEIAEENDVFEDGTLVNVAGWGLQENGVVPYKLQKAQMSLINGPECERQAGFGYDSVLCLKSPENSGICSGDNGAGVVIGKKLIAVISFAFGGCGTKYPDVSSKLSFYKLWIDNIIA